MKTVIFLDFDGVLHPYLCMHHELFEGMSLLAPVLHTYKDEAEIVISSSWREHHRTGRLLKNEEEAIALANDSDFGLGTTRCAGVMVGSPPGAGSFTARQPGDPTWSGGTVIRHCAIG